MTQQTSQNMPPPTAQVAKQEAAEVGRTSAEAGRHVADTAAEQAGQVAQEARRQARDLLGEVRDQATQQARTGQQNAVDSIRGLAGELREMAANSERRGTATELAAQAADRLGSVANWIGAREPGDLVNEVRRFARRRPGAFLLGAAAAGILAGRLTRGTVDAQRDTASDSVANGFPAAGPTAPLPVAPSPAVRPLGPPPGYAPPPGAGPAPGIGSVPGVGSEPGGPLGAPPQPYAPDGGTYRPGSVPPSQPPLPSGPQHASPVYPPPPAPQQSPGRPTMTAGEYVQDRERGTDPTPGDTR